MNIFDFANKARNTKEVTFVKDNSGKDIAGIWNVDFQIWSKSKKVLDDLSFHCPNDFDITCIDSHEYMMQVYSTSRPQT